MVDCGFFYQELNKRGINFFTGVPDSLLKSPCAFISGNAPSSSHIIAANEGGAIALACGHYLATGKMGLVYMQNSGLGNAINPLVSLADREIYGIPLILLIGWRGEPKETDEPQHIKQGKITLKLLNTLGIPYRILPSTDSKAKDCLDYLVKAAYRKKTPVGIVVKKDTFKECRCQTDIELSSDLTREESIRLILDRLNRKDIVISTTGKASRELYECREQLKQGHCRDFLTVGSMGHASQIALAVALEKPSRRVFCIDGDGAVIMHMGSLAVIGSQKARNFKHIIINNASHDSVGGQPTVGEWISFTGIAKACGYKSYKAASSAKELKNVLNSFIASPGPALLEVRVKKGSRKDLTRPKSLKKAKKDFMNFVSL